MKRFRLALLTASLALVLCFAGLLTAGLTSNESLFQALGNLAEVVHLVQSEYVDELDPEVLSLALDAGVLESLDPWAAVVSDDQVDAYERVFSNPPPYGLGLSLRFGSAAVRFVFPGSPADQAGLDRWEVIEKIDGVYTRGRPLWHVALELAEKEAHGDTVHLTVMDREVDQRREIALLVTEWTPVLATASDVPSTDGQPPVRVVKIDSLTGGSSAAVTDLIDGSGAAVLDLRGLVWGVEDEAIKVADLFVGQGTLAAWRGREAGREVIEASEAVRARLPTVIVDGETEWPGEILAAALKRSGAVIVGQSTMGHAPHMQVVRDGDLNLWIPVGRWLAPDDEPIQERGVTPDEEIEAADDESGGDPMLDRAVELARGGLAEAA
ncbi:MAG: S41 family peptidase [Holophagae bacterium]|jgi:carboxyl-terminal processing protease